MGSLAIGSLSNEITVNQSSKLKLAQFTLDDCEVCPDAYTRMSHCIASIGVFGISESACSNGENVQGGITYKAVKTDMSLTALGALVYSSNRNEFAVKIVSCSRIILLRVLKGKGIQRLADDSLYVSNFASETKKFHISTLCCNRVFLFSVEGCGSIIVS